MLNSSHMVPYSFVHFSAFIAYIFTFARTHHRLYLCTLTPRVVVYAYKQKEIRLLWCTSKHLQPWLLFGCTFLSQSFSVRSCWFRHLLTAASALRDTAVRHHTEPRRHYGVFAGSKCCMWLSIHQVFGVMRYSTRKLFPRSFFQIIRPTCLPLWNKTKCHKREVTDVTTSVQHQEMSALDVVHSPAHLLQFTSDESIS